MRQHLHRRRSATKHAGILALAIGTLFVSGCDSLLEVDVPGNLTEDALFQPESAQILINSLIADFECSFTMMSASNSGFEDATWRTSGYWTASATYFGERPGTGSCPNNSDVGTDWFTGLQKSRYVAEKSFEAMEGWTAEQVPNRTELMATAATYAGLFYQIFGETYCEFAPAVGPILTPTEMLERSEEWFGRALSTMGSQDFSIVSTESLKQLAYLGRARARLAMGDLAGAAADASEVQPGFVAWVTRDATVRGRWNAVAQAFNVSRWRTIGGPMYWNDYEDDTLVSAGYYDLTIREEDGWPTVDDGVPDPRVPVIFTGEFSQDGITDQWNQQKYTSQGDPQHLARYAEAQLILAEVDWNQTQDGSAVDRINALRDVHSLPHFEPDNREQIMDVIIEERRREFFMENRHHADKLRYGLWFPRGRGKDHKGFTFGFAYCLLMPTDEYELNPNVADGYEGPDLSDLSYTFELELDREPNWPVH